LIFAGQTNLSRLSAETISFSREHAIHWGFSLDGPTRENDVFRVLRSGAGTHDRFEKALAEFPEFVRGCSAMATITSANYDNLLGISRYFQAVGLRGWDWLGNRIKSFPRDTPLYISPQDSVGEVRTDPYVFTNERRDPKEVQSFEVKLNLWWSPGDTDCFIHNEHQFLEVHTQIHGTGRMQKFRERDEQTLYEDVVMPPGYTHDPFCRVAAGGKAEYPFHRYYADSDCVWLAIELHPKNA